MLKNILKYCKGLFHADFRDHVEKAVDTLNENKKGHGLSFSVFKEIPWHEYGHLYIEMSKLTLRTPYMDNDLVKLMYQAPHEIRAAGEIRMRLIEDGSPQLQKIMTDRGTAGQLPPVLSKIAQLFFYSLFKAEYVYLFQLPHFFAKLDHAFAALHPERFLAGRYQFGYYRLWFRDELSGYIQDILLDKRTVCRPYWNKACLEKVVYDHIKGRRNNLNEINKVLTVELIHRLLIEKA